MSVIPRTLSHQEAEYLARTVISRTSVKGRVEYLGLSYKSDALLEWEIRQREMNVEPKVDVRIDELDLSYVYVDTPDGSGPFKAISRQPSFTTGLSVYELNKLKAIVTQKELGDRLGRLDDEDALKLRLENYDKLGHKEDPVAKRRLSELHNELARLRLETIEQNESEEPTSAAASPEDPPGKPRRKSRAQKLRNDSDPAPEMPTAPAPTPTSDVSCQCAPEPSTPPPSDGPTSNCETLQINRRTL